MAPNGYILQETLCSKVNFEYNYELIFDHEKQNLNIQDIDFSVHFVVVALVQMVPKKV